MKYIFTVGIFLLLAGCAAQKSLLVKNCQLVGPLRSGDRLSECDELGAK